VLSFASRTWDDWDYIPHAWPRWIDDPGGILLVGTRPDDTPVAVVRVALPAPGEAWLEGIRVDPAVRGMDVASDLQVAELQWAAANGARIVRYATSARNEGSHRLGARGGFEHVATLSSTWWDPAAESGGHGDDSASGFLPEVQEAARERRRGLLKRADYLADGDTEAAALWSFLTADPSFNAARRLYEPRPWALEELTREKFNQHVRSGEVLVRRSDEGLAVAIMVAAVEPAEDSALRLAMLTGEPSVAFDLVERLRELSGEAIRFRFAKEAPLVDAVVERYRAAGYHFPDWALHVLARTLDDGNPPPRIDPDRVVLVDPPAAVIGSSM
jgi:GNAT superfamily N-acetyltransferase